MKRGEVYWADFSPAIGHEQVGVRPVLVVQNDVGNRVSPVTIVVPITSRPRKAFPFLVRIPDGVLPSRSTADCAHIRTVDKRRITGEPVATLDQPTMALVDEALRISLALD